MPVSLPTPAQLKAIAAEMNLSLIDHPRPRIATTPGT